MTAALSNIFKVFYFMCMGILIPYMSVSHACSTQGDQKRFVGSPETRIMDSCETSCGCWALGLGHLVKQLVLLPPESFLALLFTDFGDKVSLCSHGCPGIHCVD